MNTAVASNRKARRAQDGRARESRRRTGIAAAAAVTTAAALTVGVGVPSAGPRVVSISDIALAADPIDVQLDLITTGALLGLVSALGYDSFTYAASFSGQDLNLTVNLNHTGNRPENLYDTVNTLPMEADPYGPLGAFCSDSANTNGCRIAPIVTVGSGAQGLRAAMNSLYSIALGTNLQQYMPLVKGYTGTTGIIINNPYRPNGGIDGRFGASLQKLGSAPSDPKDDGTSIGNYLADLTWEYQPQADFPVTFNPFSLVNSFMGVLPPITDLLTTPALDIVEKQLATTTGVGGKTFAPGDADNLANLLGILQFFAGGTGDDAPPFDAIFATLVSGTLPMFEPNALGTYLTNSVLKKINSPFLFGDVISDLFTPAMRILVNIGYADVITPNMLAGDPELAKAGYKAYDRTFAQQQIDFGTVQPLTFEEQIQAYGAAWNAFTNSLKEQFAKPFFGIIVPNTIPGGTAARSAATAESVVAAPAPAAAVAAPAPVVQEAVAPAAPVVAAPVVSVPEVSAPANDTPAVVAPVVADVAIPDAPVVEAPAADAAPADAPASAIRGHRGSSAQSDSGSDTPGGGASAHSGARGHN